MGKTAESFNYLRHSGCTSVPNIKDNVEYTNLRVRILFHFLLIFFSLFLPPESIDTISAHFLPILLSRMP